MHKEATSERKKGQTNEEYESHSRHTSKYVVLDRWTVPASLCQVIVLWVMVDGLMADHSDGFGLFAVQVLSLEIRQKSAVCFSVSVSHFWRHGPFVSSVNMTMAVARLRYRFNFFHGYFE
jgi:hypothetical protein